MNIFEFRDQLIFLGIFGISPLLARNDFFFPLSGLSGKPKSPGIAAKRLSLFLLL
jgi:hypothetical protein